MMRFVRRADHHPIALLPDCLNVYVKADNPVRVIDAFVNELDWFPGIFPSRQCIDGHVRLSSAGSPEAREAAYRRSTNRPGMANRATKCRRVHLKRRPPHGSHVLPHLRRAMASVSPNARDRSRRLEE